MKSFLILTVLVFCSFQSFAQDPQLFTNDWTLIKIVIDGEDIFVPQEEPEIMSRPFIVEFTATQVRDEYCGNGGFGDVVYAALTSFSFPEGYIYLAGSCNTEAPMMFEREYQPFYFEANSSLNYNYVFEDEDDGDTGLIITRDSDGMQAFYTSGEVL